MANELTRARVSIGDFSRMTHLSVKALRHYHDVGLLAPAEIDQASGYRYYARSQVPAAQIIRRFRALEMPVEEIRDLLGTSDPGARNKLIAAHLQRLEQKLEETRGAVASLRALLEPAAGAAISIEHRSIGATTAIAIAANLRLSDATVWMREAFRELRRIANTQGLTIDGVPGGVWSTELFLEEAGDAIVFLPVAGHARRDGRVMPMSIPAAELAIAVHAGLHADIDRTYGALGTHVHERELGVEGPVREYYLRDESSGAAPSEWVTEIGWPIFRAEKSIASP